MLPEPPCYRGSAAKRIPPQEPVFPSLPERNNHTSNQELKLVPFGTFGFALAQTVTARSEVRGGAIRHRHVFLCTCSREIGNVAP